MKWITGTGELSLVTKQTRFPVYMDPSVPCRNHRESLARSMYQALWNSVSPRFRKGVNTCLNPSSFRKVQRLVCNLKHVFNSSWFPRWTHAYVEMYFFRVFNLHRPSSCWRKESRCIFPGGGRGTYKIIWRNPFHLREAVLLDVLKRDLSMVTPKCWHFLVSALVLTWREVCF